MVEHEADTAASSECAAALCEITADIGHCSGIVVSCSLYEVSDSEWTISLESHLLEISKGLVGSLLDSSLDIVLRHVLVSCLSDKRTETRVTYNIRTALLNCDGNFLSDFGERLGHVAPTFHLSLFSELKRSSHNYLFSILLIYLSIS